MFAATMQNKESHVHGLRVDNSNQADLKIELLVKKSQNRMSVSVRGLRNMGALRAWLPFAAPVCSQFVGRSEHTCGTKAQ